MKFVHMNRQELAEREKMMSDLNTTPANKSETEEST